MIAEASTADPISTATAIVTGLGLLASAVGVAAVKISGCLNDIRREVHRSRAEVRSSSNDQNKGLTDISRQLAGVRMLITTHVDLSDHRFAELNARIGAIEKENERL